MWATETYPSAVPGARILCQLLCAGVCQEGLPGLWWHRPAGPTYSRGDLPQLRGGEALRAMRGVGQAGGENYRLWDGLRVLRAVLSG